MEQSESLSVNNQGPPFFPFFIRQDIAFTYVSGPGWIRKQCCTKAKVGPYRLKTLPLPPHSHNWRCLVSEAKDTSATGLSLHLSQDSILYLFTIWGRLDRLGATTTVGT